MAAPRATAPLPPPLPTKERRRHQHPPDAIANHDGGGIDEPNLGAGVGGGGENNKRRSVNIMPHPPTSALNRLSKMVKSGASKVFHQQPAGSNASSANNARKSMALKSAPVEVPAKLNAREEVEEPVPMLHDAAPPPPPSKKEKVQQNAHQQEGNNRKSFFQRVSARLRPTKVPTTGPLFASKYHAADNQENAQNQEVGQEQLPDDQISPRYRELPSLLEFYVEDEERAELLDAEEPKINGASIIVLAFGEGTIQTGLGSSEAGPDSVYPALSGEPQSFNVRVMDSFVNEKNPIKFGEDAACRRGIYALEWFNDTENGKPKYNLVGDAMAYNSGHVLRRPLKQDAVIFPMNMEMPLERKSKMLSICFEKVGARAVRVCSEEKAALQFVTKQSHPTGLVVDIGHSKTRCVAIVDGELAEITMKTTVSAGKMMTLRMFSLLRQRTEIFDQNMTGSEFARESKEKHAFVSVHAPTEQELAGSAREFETVFHLKDGQDVVLGHERYLCAETLFQPEKDEGKLSYLKAASLQQTILDCLKANDRDIWNDLLRNVVVIGGVSQLPGLKQRLEAELYKLLPPAHFRHLQITIDPFAGWKGARLASLSESEVDQWISRREWREGGETVVSERLQAMRL